MQLLLNRDKMIVLIKLDRVTYEKISALVKDGKYPSIESFLDIAVKNQLLLEGEEKTHATRQNISHDTGKEKFSLSLPSQQPKTVPPPSPEESIKNAPLWGQINRLGPAKFVLRILLNGLVSSDDNTLDLKKFSAEVAERATEFRLFAKRKDKKSRVRGEYLYVGFPKKDPFSQQRFLNYYVGKAPLQKWTDSVLLGLGLADIVEAEDGSRVIGITDAGLKFSMFNSPLIDEFLLKEKQISLPFSDEEISFLIDQIRSFRPGEFEFLKFVLTSIRNGADIPTKLKDKVFDFLKNKDLQIKLSEKVAITMMVGAVGRLVEMGFIRIEKEAQKSKYILTDKVEALVGKF